MPVPNPGSPDWGDKRRALMRFPKLNISGYDVTSASVSIRDLMCEGTTLRVECREYTGNSWSESGTTTWSNAGNSAGGSVLSYQNISYGIGNAFTQKHRYTFDITSLARKWAAGTSSPSKGIVFRTTDSHESGSSTDGRTFASINRGSNPPRLTVTYFDSTISISSSSNQAVIGSTIQIIAETSAPQSSITWSSSDESIASVSNTGLVTLHKLDKATITAQLPNGKSDAIVVYGYFNGGIYSLKNSGSYYTMTMNSEQVFTAERPYLYNSPWATESQYWRIKHIDMLSYTIEPYMNSSHRLAYDSSHGVHFSTVYSSEPSDNELWDITTGVTYQSIRHHDSKLALASPTYPVNYDRLTMESYDASPSASPQRWIMAEIKSPKSGMVWQVQGDNYCHTISNENVVMKVNETRSYKIMYYSASKTTGNLDWPIKQPEIPYDYEVVTHAHQAYDIVTAKNPGQTEVTVKYGGTTLLTIQIRVYKLPTLVGQGQRKSNWCWAAAARMFMEYYVFVDSGMTQNIGVNVVKGDERNEGGTNDEIIKIANYYGWANTDAKYFNWINSDDFTSKVSEDIRDKYAILSEDCLRRILDNNHVVLISRGVYSREQERQSGHESLVIGYTTQIINGVNQYIYTIYDPFPEKLPPMWGTVGSPTYGNNPCPTSGQKFEWTYQQICRGNGDDLETWTFWDGFVIVNPGFLIETTSPVFPDDDIWLLY